MYTYNTLVYMKGPFVLCMRMALTLELDYE